MLEVNAVCQYISFDTTQKGNQKKYTIIIITSREEMMKASYQRYNRLVNYELYIEIARFEYVSVFLGKGLDLVLQPDHRPYHAIELGLLQYRNKSY